MENNYILLKNESGAIFLEIFLLTRGNFLQQDMARNPALLIQSCLVQAF